MKSSGFLKESIGIPEGISRGVVAASHLEDQKEFSEKSLSRSKTLVLEDLSAMIYSLVEMDLRENLELLLIANPDLDDEEIVRQALPMVFPLFQEECQKWIR